MNEESAPTKYRIVEVHELDAYYSERRLFIGAVGVFDLSDAWGDGWSSGKFTPDTPTGSVRDHFFYRVRVVPA